MSEHNRSVSWSVRALLSGQWSDSRTWDGQTHTHRFIQVTTVPSPSGVLGGHSSPSKNKKKISTGINSADYVHT